MNPKITDSATHRPITYVLIGDPVPLARPRMSGPNRIIYDSQKLIKHSLVNQLLEQHGDRPLYSGPVHLDAIFYMKMPKGMLKQTAKNSGKHHIYKPDLDNLIKMIGDIATIHPYNDDESVLLKDDCIIASITAKKLYDIEPKTVFTITELT